jgi:hypothetical protein
VPKWNDICSSGVNVDHIAKNQIDPNHFVLMVPRQWSAGIGININHDDEVRLPTDNGRETMPPQLSAMQEDGVELTAIQPQTDDQQTSRPSRIGEVARRRQQMWFWVRRRVHQHRIQHDQA